MEIIELDGVQLRFDKLQLKHEQEWQAWLKADLMTEARRDVEAMSLVGDDKANFLATISAKFGGGVIGLRTPYGMERALMTDAGRIQILRMASRKHHPAPGIDDGTLYRLVGEKLEDVTRVIQAIYPLNIVQGGAEKKPAGGELVGPASTSPKSNDT